MNFYIVTEGKVEAKIYKHWVPLIDPNLSLITNVGDFLNNNFLIVSAKGYPDYFDVIDAAIEDSNGSGRVDRLVITIDSEEMTRDQKYKEVEDFLSGKKCHAEIRIVVQHYCFEVWALGNRVVIRKKPTSQRLRSYKRFYDVRIRDPELMPAMQEKTLYRAKFAEMYLRAALNDRFRNLTYTKHNPSVLLHHKYFAQVRSRLHDTRHISSFEFFLDAFI